jgi:TolB-like protein
VTKPSAAARERARDQPAPALSRAAWAELDVLCLTAMHDQPERRYPSVEALIRDVDHFLAQEPLEARADSFGYRAGKYLARNWRAIAAAAVIFVVGGALALALNRATRSLSAADTPPGRIIAVLPLQSGVPDSSLDYLRQALGAEIAAALGAIPGIQIRPFEATSRFVGPNLDLRSIGHEMRAGSVVTGHFEPTSDGLRIYLAATNAEDLRPLWLDTIDVRGRDLTAFQIDVAGASAPSLAATLGVGSLPTQASSRPRNAAAYDLYLRSASGSYDPGPFNDDRIRMLERAVAMDSTYSPAWLALGRRLYVKTRYDTGDTAAMARGLVAAERAVALDPTNVTAGARLAGSYAERGEHVRAYREITRLIRRRPDSPDAHFYLSYLLRHVVLLQEASAECAVALSLDAHNWGWRTCAVTLMGLGDYEGARGYLDLDPGSEMTRALTIHLLVRSGRETEALALSPPRMAQWTSYKLLLGCVAKRPAAEIATLAAAVKPNADPETNYFAAAHLGYCGLTDQSLDLLGRAIRGGYCSYPIMTSDPFFAAIRTTPQYSAVREAGAACHQAFLTARRDLR